MKLKLADLESKCEHSSASEKDEEEEQDSENNSLKDFINDERSESESEEELVKPKKRKLRRFRLDSDSDDDEDDNKKKVKLEPPATAAAPPAVAAAATAVVAPVVLVKPALRPFSKSEQQRKRELVHPERLFTKRVELCAVPCQKMRVPHTYFVSTDNLRTFFYARAECSACKHCVAI